MSRGKFVVVSGGEGSGKTTLIDRLRTRYPTAVFTREPGGTPLGEALRHPLLNPEFHPVVGTELFLFMAIRAQHVAEVINPALEQGKLVICDRYLEDTFAYQWYARMNGTNPVLLYDMARVTNAPRADLWLYLDVDPLIGLARRQKAGGINRIDDEKIDFHRRVRQGFQLLLDGQYQTYAHRSHQIDASQSPEEVYREAHHVIDLLLA